MSVDITQASAQTSNLISGQEVRYHTFPLEKDATTIDVKDRKTEVTLNSFVSKTRTDDSHDIDHINVERISTALANNELLIDPKKIAQALVQKLYEF